MIPAFYSSVLTLVAQNRAALMPTHGQHAHAAFMGLLREVSPEFAAALHGFNGRKPFTVSPLMGDGALNLREGDARYLRVTLIGRDLFDLFTQRFVNSGLPMQLRVGEAVFAVAGVRATNGSHAWAGCESAAELVSRSLNGPPAREVALEFITPTAFQADGRALVMPIPQAVFGNLLSQWQTMGCGETLDMFAWAQMAAGRGHISALEEDGTVMSDEKIWRKVFAECVHVKKMRDLNTRALQIKGAPFLGFTGQVGFEIIGESPVLEDVARMVNILADAAFYFGVGRKTTMGMGQCRRLHM